MPEPFKNSFNPDMIALMAHHLKRVWNKFDDSAFVAQATHNLEDLELKQRADQINRALQAFLPDTFTKAAPILLAALHPEDDVDLSGTGMDARGIRGWAILPMTQYVGERGIDDFDLGMSVQKELTKRFSSEFGVRHFILHDQDRTLATIEQWAEDENFHVLRLASEGARPRLPWAMRIPSLIENPTPLFPILEKLKDDPVEYVRRSIANNLNDIAKDHPDTVAELAERWLKNATHEQERLVRHACRTLVKQGHAKTLMALGYGPPKATLAKLEVLSPKVRFGDAVNFEIQLRSETEHDQNLILDYIIHHVKANGQTTPKVFKWKTFTLKARTEHSATRKHPIKTITTRTYYPGVHRVELQLNGQSLGEAEFELIMPKE